MRRAGLVLVGLMSLVVGLLGPSTIGKAAPAAPVSGRAAPQPGAPGIGDPYFPLDGNGGYDVAHYDLRVDYRPSSNRLRGRATITARATKSLSRFDLDLVGLTVSSVRVNGRPARWSRSGQELQVTPARPLRKGRTFSVVVRYAGVPGLVDDGGGGVFPTNHGAIIIGEPHVAATWFPVNDHPLDKATYRVRVTVPRGVEAVSNGALVKVDRHRRTTSWTWRMDKPMASYLATATVGQFNLKRYRADGVSFLDAIDPALFDKPEPRSGDRFAASGADDFAYKRLTRVIPVPAAGGRLSFWVDRSTETDWDYFFVEAHPVGSDDWTTLPDLNGHSATPTGYACPGWLGFHPFLAHYQSADGQGGCASTGTTGSWNAATGFSAGYEQWTVDLAAYAGRSVELSLTVASDDIRNAPRGVYVDDIVGPGGAGSTSFESDADPFDGWAVSGPPSGSPGNPADWRLTSEGLAPTTGERAAAAFAQEPQILRFLSGILGPYPFRQAGGIVDNDLPALGYALENQTRPIYSRDFFDYDLPSDDTSVVVHELAHQWTGDSLSVAAWKEIWLNEGFATYAQWLWSEQQGDGTAQQIFDEISALPADHPMWATTIGDPGADGLFGFQVYDRGALTLHALRLQIGDDAFFRLLKTWTASHRYGNVTTAQFQSLAERLSGQDLDAFFQTWLYTPSKPAGLDAPSAARRSSAWVATKQLKHQPLLRR